MINSCFIVAQIYVYRLQICVNPLILFGILKVTGLSEIYFPAQCSRGFGLTALNSYCDSSVPCGKELSASVWDRYQTSIVRNLSS